MNKKDIKKACKQGRVSVSAMNFIALTERVTELEKEVKYLKSIAHKQSIGEIIFK